MSKTVFIHLLHRFIGILILIFSLGLFVLPYYRKMSESMSNNSRRLFFLVLFQVALGIFVVISRLAFTMTAIHLLVALLIVAVLLNIIFEKKDPVNQ